MGEIDWGNWPLWLASVVLTVALLFLLLFAVVWVVRWIWYRL